MNAVHWRSAEPRDPPTAPLPDGPSLCFEPSATSALSMRASPTSAASVERPSQKTAQREQPPAPASGITWQQSVDRSASLSHDLEEAKRCGRLSTCV